MLFAMSIAIVTIIVIVAGVSWALGLALSLYDMGKEEETEK